MQLLGRLPQSRRCVDAGGLEPMWCTTDFIDGGESTMAMVLSLKNMVRLALQASTPGVDH
jgi:hypothetical protein